MRYVGDTEAQRDNQPAGEARVPVLLVVGQASTGGRPPAARVINVDRTLEICRDDGGCGPGVWLVADRQVSARHARITTERQAYEVEDLGSTNGTTVDGVRVAGRAPLRDGSLLGFGGCTAVFRLVSHRELTAIERERATPLGPIATASPFLAVVCERLRKLAATETELLLVGETGTGKEIYARAIHAVSGRSGPFVGINCAALPRELVESELFGYARGAHSTARADKSGLLEAAEGGTVFLDEIGDMPTEVQAKLLRFLQDRVMLPLGATRPRKIDVRILAATNHAVDERLRPDLLARLGADPVRLPPLRDRREDLGSLVAHFLANAAAAFTARAWTALCLYTWPRNVRELEKVVQTAATLAAGEGAIDVVHLPEGLAAREVALAREDAAIPKRRPSPSREELVALLQQHEGNVANVARALDRKWQVVWRWLKTHGLDADDFRKR